MLEPAERVVQNCERTDRDAFRDNHHKYQICDVQRIADEEICDVLSDELDKETLLCIFLIRFDYLFGSLIEPVVHDACNVRIHAEFLSIVVEIEDSLDISSLAFGRVSLDPGFIVDLDEHLVEKITDDKRPDDEQDRRLVLHNVVDSVRSESRNTAQHINDYLFNLIDLFINLREREHLGVVEFGIVVAGKIDFGGFLVKHDLDLFFDLRTFFLHDVIAGENSEEHAERDAYRKDQDHITNTLKRISLLSCFEYITDSYRVLKKDRQLSSNSIKRRNDNKCR